MKNLIIILFILLNVQFAFATVRSFDGIDDEVDMGTVLNVTTGNVSLCIYVQMIEDVSIDEIIGKKFDANTKGGYILKQTGADLINFTLNDQVDVLTSISTTDVDGIWSFICGTYNSSTQTTILYINGIQEDTDTNTGVGNIGVVGAAEFAIGENADETNDMNGLAAYGMQFTTVLTVVEITELMWKPGSLPSNGFWPMYGGDSPEQDLSGNNNDGTVTGATTNAGGPPVFLAGGLPL